MDPKVTNTDTDFRDADLDIDEELAGVLTAISIVSKRLAKKIFALRQRAGHSEQGGEVDGVDE